MIRPARQLRLALIAVLTVGVLAIFGGSSTVAQTTTAQGELTSVNIVAVVATQATISFSYSTNLPRQAAPDCAVLATVNYGPTTAYGTTIGPLCLTETAGSQVVSLDPLNPGMTYHFQIKLMNVDRDRTVLATSNDRAFTTPAGGGTSPLYIERILADCLDVSCQIWFRTTRTATVSVKWSLSVISSYTEALPEAAETTPEVTYRSLRIPNISDPPFTRNTAYHYMLRAVDAFGNTFTTGDLSARTSASSTDHTFSTGTCIDTTSGTPVSVPIGTCYNKKFCTTSAILIEDCTKCGFTCPTDPASTCRQVGTSGVCELDPALNNSPRQCNTPTCYSPNGELWPSAPAGCYSSWPLCNANTILKVRKDRGCNLWLTCSTSTQTDATSAGPGENLCLSLAGCNSLNTKGQCNHFLPLGQCSNNPLRFCNLDSECQAGGACNLPPSAAPTSALATLTFQSPSEVKQIADLSGNVIAGLDWGQQGGANVIQGLLPWQLMRQIGGDAQIKNGDLEFRAPSVLPWIAVPENETPSGAVTVDFEERDAGFNHVLKVEPVTQTSAQLCSNNANITCIDPASCTLGPATCDKVKQRCQNDPLTACTTDTQCPVPPATTPPTSATCLTIGTPVKFSGAATNSFPASPSEFYYAEARIRADSGNPVVRMQFGSKSYTKFDWVDVVASTVWQRVTIGPLSGLSGPTRLAFVCGESDQCGPFMVDDVVVKPVLQTSTRPSYVAPSCRLYAKNDSPACDYADQNGVIYRGWKGYCLERDSQTGTCISWWPVDIIRGESSIFGTETTAGYQDRAPLYLCAESAGNGQTNGKYTVDLTACYPTYTTNCGGAAGIFAGASDTGYFGREGANALAAVDPDKQIRVQDVIGVEMKIVSPTNGDFDGIQNFWFTADTTAATGACLVNGTGQGDYAGEPWSYCWSSILGNGPHPPGGTGEQFFTIMFLWDPIDGHLTGWNVYGRDANAGGYISFQLTFHMKETCNKLVEVVDQNGSASVFAARVNSSSFTVPGLQYTKKTDLTPYGGALQPLDTDQPSSWPPLSAEQPNYTKISPPGQARSGSPYACNGPCTDIVCSVDSTYSCLNTGKTAVDPSRVATCQRKDINGDSIGDGDCVGVNGGIFGAAGASARTTQLFGAAQCIGGFCSNGGLCGAQITATCSAVLDVQGDRKTTLDLATKSAASKCGIDAGGRPSMVACDGTVGACTGEVRLYDTYRVTSTQHNVTQGYYIIGVRCSVSPAKQSYKRGNTSAGSCSASADCQAAYYLGTPQPAETSYFAQEHIKRLFAKSLSVWTLMRCDDATHSTPCNTSTQCSGTTNCSYRAATYAQILSSIPNTDPSDLTNIEKFVGWLPPADRCPANPAVVNQCTSTTQACTASVDIKGVTPLGITVDQEARDAAMLDARHKCGIQDDGTLTLTACNGANPECPGSTSYKAGTTAKYTDFKLTLPCSSKTNTTTGDIQYTCPGRCSSTQSYIRAFKPTTAPTAKYLRPDYVAGSSADYCAVPPEVPKENVKFVTGTATKATITGGSSSVAIKFNTVADKEQVPLANIRIDWGDSQDTFAFPFAPRSDPTKPHIFSHTYILNRSPNTYCTTVGNRQNCEYPIKIQVEDTWGWCNDAGATLPCHTAKFGNDAYDSTAWIDSGLRVILQP